MTSKLRASCDACHFAKVKCSKLNGGCQRCCSLGEICSYSPAIPRSYKRKSVSQLPNPLSQPSWDPPVLNASAGQGHPPGSGQPTSWCWPHTSPGSSSFNFEYEPPEAHLPSLTTTHLGELAILQEPSSTVSESSFPPQASRPWQRLCPQRVSVLTYPHG